jgi:hypothetical protein
MQGNPPGNLGPNGWLMERGVLGESRLGVWLVLLLEDRAARSLGRILNGTEGGYKNTDYILNGIYT